MNTEDRLAAFVALGQKIAHYTTEERESLARRARYENPWFDPIHVEQALNGLCRYLERPALENWLSSYPAIAKNKVSPKNVGVIMAGNIPVVGVHDFICVLMSGHHLLAKLSSQDTVLMKHLAQELVSISPEFAHSFTFAERLTDADAFIATGSDNTARYFQYYFQKKPNIIRKNRIGLGILNGKEDAEALKRLSEDILTYYGLGCRNVAKVMLPTGTELIPLIRACEPLGEVVIQNNKYANNFDYHHAVLLINQHSFLTNNSLIFKEDPALASPLSILHYEFYDDIPTLENYVTDNAERLQCVVSDKGWFRGSMDFGQAQQPTISDYADGVDTMRFLEDI